MGTGRITDFSKPNQGQKPLQRVEQRRRGSSVEVLDKNSLAQPTVVELNLHEEVILPDQNNPRIRLKKDGTPDLRFRNAPTQKEWDKIKRGIEK